MKLSRNGHVPSPGELIDFLLLYGKHYLGSGGPTSRLEESITRLGNHFGQQTEVFATPTGIFITSQNYNDPGNQRTALTRIKSTATDLSRICILERIFNDILEDKLTLFTASETLRNSIMVRPLYRIWQTGLAAFIAGFAVSYGSYGRLTAALVSGTITLITWFVTAAPFRKGPTNPMYTDFVGAFLTLALAAVAHILFAPVSIEAYALGGLVLLVPGLALTTSIAELADQNLVSGTAKFMQACLSLLAIGLAYLLFQQLAESFSLLTVLRPIHSVEKTWPIAMASVIAVASCFSVIFRVPPRSLIWATITGLCGWATLESLGHGSFVATAPYFGSFVVGIVSLSFGRLFKMPSQVYSVPGIVAMLPGMLALSVFQYFAAGKQQTGIAYSFQVALTAVSIVFGLITARVPFSIMASNRFPRRKA